METESVGAKGDPQKPLSQDEIVQKYLALTTGIILSEKQSAIISAVQQIETMPDINDLTRLLE